MSLTSSEVTNLVHFGDLAPWNTRTAAVDSSTIPTSPSLVLVQDSSTCSGEFILAQFIKDKLKRQESVCLILIAHEYDAFNAILAKQGVQLERYRKAGLLYVVDASLAPHERWIAEANSTAAGLEAPRVQPSLTMLAGEVAKYFKVWYNDGIANSTAFNVVVDNLMLLSSLYTSHSMPGESRTQILDWIGFLRRLVTSGKAEAKSQSSTNQGCVLIGYPQDLSPAYEVCPVDTLDGQTAAREGAPVGLSAIVTTGTYGASNSTAWIVNESLPDAVLSVTQLSTGYSKDLYGRLAVYVPSQHTRLVNIPGASAAAAVSVTTAGGGRSAPSALSLGLGASVDASSSASREAPSREETMQRLHGAGGYYKIYHIQLKDSGAMCMPR